MNVHTDKPSTVKYFELAVKSSMAYIGDVRIATMIEKYGRQCLLRAVFSFNISESCHIGCYIEMMQELYSLQVPEACSAELSQSPCEWLSAR